MKVLVTGAAGLLGTEVLRVFGSRHDVTGVDLGDFDIADLAATSAALSSHRPDVVVHCAAWSDVDGAESAFEQAFLANAIGAKNVALAANDAGARLIHISTDYVFDGEAGRPYVESDLPDPTGVYGRSKWMGEQLVREIADGPTVVRTQALYGATGRSFVTAILDRVRAGEPLRVVDDQTVCPTRAADLAEALLRIATEGTPGIYHASSRGECTWFRFAQAILAKIGNADHPLSPVSSEEFARPAPRPPYSVLRNLHLELTIGDTLPHWEEALGEHLRSEGIA